MPLPCPGEGQHAGGHPLLFPSDGGINSFELPGWAPMRVSSAGGKEEKEGLCLSWYVVPGSDRSWHRAAHATG